MIRHAISEQALLDAIEAHRPGWLERARQSTKEAIQARHVAPEDAIWSEIKAVFARIQHHKCIYCEKPLPREDDAGEASMGKGAKEYDVEHFRPKNAVKPWPGPELVEKRQIDYAAKLSRGEPGGYVRLAFDPMNYALSCATCNSGHKGNAFPIAGKRKKRATKRSTLDASEKPLLMLPLGDSADDPEQILGWDGPLPVPRKKSGHGRLRARVCIDLFALDTRDDLFLLRCLLIQSLWTALQAHRLAKGAEKKERLADLQGLTADHMPFAACARAYVALFEQDPGKARTLYENCRAYLTSRDRAVFT